ncbi:type IX secretion system membrane protein PorP/SprF [Ferruginibacter lapsinanis]|uniref:PorP/SprF family type IX secretion system membrane protein n=1 Tax=Ferruginibacter lapsinanis TaxID=563172 RepID=UPI001E4C252A|nr:type IX secretion system membrane protein PorP/SprF [Ferruginibacter lapsinanis]UEG49091.1 type IX secretion system membrane protein PorP/SprF [Ferruginibacter lapsinanis]
MKLKKIFSVLMLSSCFANAGAQQVFKISQFTQHNYLFNPAAAGANDIASVGVTYRKMWSGITGGPQTVLLFADKYFAKKNTGVGFFLYDDKTGPTSRTGGELNLSYSVKLGSDSKRLMLGLAGEVLQYKIDKAAMQNYIPDDPLLASSGSTIKGDAAAGIYYKSPTLNLGVSIKNILQSKLEFIKGSTNPSGKLYRHYYFMGSYNWKVDEDNVIVPNALVQYLPNAPVDVQAGVRLEHKDLLWVGGNYTYKQSYSLFAGVKINHKLAIGYGYDQYNTPLSIFDNGGDAHEIMIRYFFLK